MSRISTADVITDVLSEHSNSGTVTVATAGQRFSSGLTDGRALILTDYILIEDQYGKRFQNREGL